MWNVGGFCPRCGTIVLLEEPGVEILRILTLTGPNYWSVERPKLMVLRLDLGAWAGVKT